MFMYIDDPLLRITTVLLEGRGEKQFLFTLFHINPHLFYIIYLLSMDRRITNNRKLVYIHFYFIK